MKTGILRLAAFFGFTAVALGSFGAHGLKTLLTTNGTSAIWQTAVDYQFYHTLALLALAALPASPARLRPPAFFWSLGLLVFSGSLYLLAITNLRWMGAITPVGGVLLLTGWLVLFLRVRLETPPAPATLPTPTIPEIHK